MTYSGRLFILLCLFAMIPAAEADIVLSSFDIAVVNDYNDFRGLGFQPGAGGGSGKLDSETYVIQGLADGNMDFGDTKESGGFARGESNGGVDTEGVYAFQVSSGNYAAGIQPGSSNVSAMFRIKNETGSSIKNLKITADALIFNDSDRSTKWSFEGSYNGTNFFELFSIISAETKSASPVWESTSLGDTYVLPIELADQQRIFVRIRASDESGSGGYDDFAVDNLSVTAVTAVPEPSSSAILLLGFSGLLISRKNRR